jgi:uroporphyrinogen-III synthase
MIVINTRPASDAAAFTAAIEAAGAVPILSPVMAIRFRDEAATVVDGEALTFTSANGVRAFARANPARRPKVFAVGEATAREAARAGFTDVATADGDVGSLANLIAETKGYTKIVHLAGSDRAGDLVAALAARGVEARRLVLYDAFPAADLSEEARLALSAEPRNCAVGLFSPRSAALFYAQTVRAGVEDRLSEATLLAFSDAVAAAALPDRWRTVKIASTRTPESMAALINA